MRVVSLLSAALFVVLSATSAAAGSDGTIGIYADASGTISSTTFSIGVPRTLFIIARLEGATAGGMTGAEFRIDGLPPDWFVFLTPHPAAAVTLGNPFTPIGNDHRANIAFSSCTAGSGGLVILYTVVVIANSEIEPRDLIVRVGNPPTNPSYMTPILTRCDAPVYSPVPAIGESLRMEVRAPQDLDYSTLPGYDSVRGVVPQRGLPGDVFRFRVSYASADGQLPQTGSPRVELDTNGDQDTDDPGEGRFSMLPADLDSTLMNGKEYRFDVALGAPPAGRYRYRFTAVDHHGAPVPGAATVWRDSLFVDADGADLGVDAEDIRVYPPNPAINEICSIMARIENRGLRPLNGVVVRIETVFGILITEQSVASLGPGAATEIACTWRFMDAGSQPILVRVDPYDEFLERTEADNSASHAVLVNSTVTGSLSFTGLPLLVTVPPVAPFGVRGNVRYNVGGLPPAPMRGAAVQVKPSWEEPMTVRTDNLGDFGARLTPPAIVGAHRIVFVATDGVRTDSTTVQVTVQPLPGQSPPHAPNLAVDLDLEAAPGCPPTQLVLTPSLENDGDQDSGPMNVRILAADLSTVATIPVGGLSAGGVLQLGPVLVPITGSGPHHFTAHVDPGSAIRELREDDNVTTASLRTPSTCFDLGIESMRFTGTRICSGETITIATRVVNNGCVASQPARVAWFAGLTEIESVPLPALAAGEAIELTFGQILPPTDCQALELVLDPEGAAGSDCDDENGRLGAAACPGTCGAPPPPPRPLFSLAACDVAASNPNPAAGEPIRFLATVRNIGPVGSTEAIHVRFEVGGAQVGALVTIPSIPAGESRSVETTTTWPASFVAQMLTVSIETHGQPNTGDFVDRALPWDFQPLPIAACPPNNPAMFSTCSPCQGDPVQINAVVLNNGLFDCDSVQVQFRENRSGGALLGATWATNVGAGTCAATGVPVSITHTFFSFGPQPVEVVLNPFLALPEQVTWNNTWSGELSVDCGTAPDLVTQVRILGTPPAPGDTVEAVEVEVNNIGTASAPNVLVLVRLDGLPLCTLDMGTIAAGTSSTVVCTTPWVADSGCSQVLDACADPDHLIGELNEANNCGTTSVSGSLQTDLGLYAFGIRVTPPNPGPGQPVDIAVTLFSHNGVESRCRFRAEWSLNGQGWLPIQDVPLQVPPNIFQFPEALRFVWVPPVPSLYLRFSLVEICPQDENAWNNVVLGSLPWFVAPGTPVLITDFVATSMPEGVRLRWSTADEVEGFALERRMAGGTAAWERLAASVVTNPSGTGWEGLDRDAPPFTELEYRLLARVDGAEEVAGTLRVTHTAAIRQVELHGVRPQPFRPGSRIEFTLPDTRTIDLGVYDAGGRRVASLRRGTSPAGMHGVTWDGRDGSGGRLPAGVYFCRLVAGSTQKTQRIVLVH